MEEQIKKVSEINSLTFEETKAIFMQVFREAIQEHNETEVMTAMEVGKLLKLPESSVMNGFREGEIPGFKLRGQVRFFKTEVLENLKEGRAKEKSLKCFDKGISKLEMYKAKGRQVNG
jgi:hypothetical protein